MDDRVKAIRQDKAVGCGSCTTIDECYEDSDLVVELDREGITDSQEAVKWARELEGLQMERALDQRWGEDDDPQLAMFAEWQDSLKNNPL